MKEKKKHTSVQEKQLSGRPTATTKKNFIHSRCSINKLDSKQQRHT